MHFLDGQTTTDFLNTQSFPLYIFLYYYIILMRQDWPYVMYDWQVNLLYYTHIRNSREQRNDYDGPDDPTVSVVGLFSLHSFSFSLTRTKRCNKCNIFRKNLDLMSFEDVKCIVLYCCVVRTSILLSNKITISWSARNPHGLLIYL